MARFSLVILNLQNPRMLGFKTFGLVILFVRLLKFDILLIVVHRTIKLMNNHKSTFPYIQCLPRSNHCWLRSILSLLECRMMIVQIILMPLLSVRHQRKRLILMRIEAKRSLMFQGKFSP